MPGRWSACSESLLPWHQRSPELATGGEGDVGGGGAIVEGPQADTGPIDFRRTELQLHKERKKKQVGPGCSGRATIRLATRE
ncbi:hypothetical protein MRX96_008961 [Rhipicephalus microplus]